MLNQAAQSIGSFQWTEGDPVSLSWRVNTDWSGTYRCQIRKSRKVTSDLVGVLAITAVFNSPAWPGETLITMTMSEADSLLIPAGKYVADMQQIGGVTRVWGTVNVGPQVTAMP